MKQVAAAATAGRLTMYRYYCDTGGAALLFPTPRELQRKIERRYYNEAECEKI